MNTNFLIASINYETYPNAIIRGRPLKCAFNLHDDTSAFLSTNKGSIGRWNWEEGTITRLEDISEPIIEFKYISSIENLFISTPYSAKTIQQESNFKASEFHLAEINNCYITDSLKIVSMSKQDKSIRWFTFNGLKLLNHHYP